METRMIGSKISKARKQVNMSQAQLAERLFISAQAVGKWERGESIPDIITINRLAEVLGVDLNYFSESFQSEAPQNAAVEPMLRKSEQLASGKKLSWDMSRENLVDGDFSGLKNLNEKFSSSNMQRCLFVGSDMSGLILNSNNIDSCDFSGSDISNSQIQNSMLAKNIFKGCLLKDTQSSKSMFDGCDFSGADFTGAAFRSGGFGSNSITDAILNGTSFIDMHIGDMIFEGALNECHFENCAFSKVTFQNATLVNTFFKNNRKLKQVRFVDCKADKLTYAFLKNGRADLTGITLLTA